MRADFFFFLFLASRVDKIMYNVRREYNCSLLYGLYNDCKISYDDMISVHDKTLPIFGRHFMNRTQLTKAGIWRLLFVPYVITKVR